MAQNFGHRGEAKEKNLSDFRTRSRQPLIAQNIITRGLDNPRTENPWFNCPRHIVWRSHHPRVRHVISSSWQLGYKTQLIHKTVDYQHIEVSLDLVVPHSQPTKPTTTFTKQSWDFSVTTTTATVITTTDPRRLVLRMAVPSTALTATRPQHLGARALWGLVPMGITVGRTAALGDPREAH